MKNKATIIKLIFTVIGFLLITACADELPQPYSGNGKDVAFSVSMAPTELAKTRASEGTVVTFATDRSVGVVPLEGTLSDGKPLYLHCHESDNEDMPMSMESPVINPSTRAEIVKNDNFYSSFKVWGYDDQNDAIFEGLSVYKSDTWVTTYMWPRNMDKFRFGAYAPGDAAGLGSMKVSYGGGMSFYYTVPDDITKQKDILAAYSNEYQGYDYQVVDMVFEHALAGIRFKFSNVDGKLDGYKIKSISLGKNISGEGVMLNSGTFRFNVASGAWEWLNQEGATSYELENSDYANYDSFYSGDDVLMVMPQDVPSGARLEVVVEAGDNTKILYANIGGSTNFIRGKLYTYTITADATTYDYEFDVDASDLDLFGTEGGTQENAVKITSYKFNSDFPGDVTKREDVPVTLNYKISSDQGYGVLTDPYGSEVRTKVDGDHLSTTGVTTLDLTMNEVTKHQTNTSKLSHKSVLNNDIVSAYHNSVDKCYNLSNPKHPSLPDVVNTANTYLIDGPGWYCIPLVYGNAITDTNNDGVGEDNKRAYQDFEYAAGSKFKDPWIKNNAPNNVVPTAGKVILDPATNKDKPTISNVSVDLDHNFLRFEVTDEIKPGNAIVAVTDVNGNILWSWQLWFTAVDYTDVTEIKNGSNTYYLAPYQIGFVAGGDASEENNMTRYPDRIIEVVVTQDRGETAGVFTKSFTIRQKGKTVNKPTGGTPTMYQWGRKDPFPGTGNLKTSPYSFDPETANSDGTAYSIKDLTNSIKYYDSFATPTRFYNYYISTIGLTDNWKATHDWQTIDNLTTQTTPQLALWREDYKTIFDPSPIGFMVPKTSVFSATTVDNEKKPEYKDGLYKIYTNGNKNVVFYVPGTGSRQTGNSSEEDPNRIAREGSACFWQTTPMSTSNLSYRIYRAFHAWNRQVSKTSEGLWQKARGGTSRADAQPVMPIKE